MLKRQRSEELEENYESESDLDITTMTSYESSVSLPLCRCHIPLALFATQIVAPGPLLTWDWMCRVCGNLPGNHSSSSIPTLTLPTSPGFSCSISMNVLASQTIGPGPMLTGNWMCRVCGDMPGNHNIHN